MLCEKQYIYLNPVKLIRHGRVYHNKTPNAFSVTILIVSMVVFGVWILGFIFTRLYMLNHEYMRIKQNVENEQWLHQQCKSSDFYHNLQHHSSLCDEVHARSKESIFISAVEYVVENTYLCGYQPCEVLLTNSISWAMGIGFPFTCFMILCVLLFPTIFFSVMKHYWNGMAEIRMRQLYNTPYGVEHYQNTTHYPCLVDSIQ